VVAGLLVLVGPGVRAAMARRHADR